MLHAINSCVFVEDTQRQHQIKANQRSKMKYEENNEYWHRWRHSDYISENYCTSSSRTCPRNKQCNKECKTDYDSNDDQISGITTLIKLPIKNVLKDNPNRCRQSRRLRRITTSDSYTTTRLHRLLFITLLLQNNSLTLTQQTGGITFGNIMNLDTCYEAMQTSQTDNKISRTQFVPFIQELTNTTFNITFASFQYDTETNTWGMFPVTDFNSLPSAIRQEFNTLACGGPNTYCTEAYLYTNGSAPGDLIPEPQQEVYLYQVCKGVESAIEDSLPKTPASGSPTNKPTNIATTASSLSAVSSPSLTQNETPVGIQAPSSNPEGGESSNVVGITVGVSVGLVVIISGFFVFRRRQALKRQFDNMDSTPSFGKRDSNESYPYNKGIRSVSRREIKSDDLELGQQDAVREEVSDGNGSMQSYSSHSSSGSSDSSSYYSSTSGSSSKDEREDGVALAPRYIQKQDQIDADDSSAGSSGWESSEGDSHTESESSFDPNVDRVRMSVPPPHDGSAIYSEEEMEDRQLMPDSLNPAVNPVVHHGVTMIPVGDGDDEEELIYPLQNRVDVAPLATDLDRAIEAGDWAAVGATAAILASDSDRDNDSFIIATKSAPVFSPDVSTGTGFSETTEEDVDDSVRAAEIDHLVETGNWDGVMAVAASMQSGARNMNPFKADDDSHHSDASSASSAEGSKGSTLLSGESSSLSQQSQKDIFRANYRAEVEALVQRVVPDEIDNIDDIMVQFSGREEELIETLKAMQEKSLSQYARAGMQRAPKPDKGVTGRSSQDDSSGNLSQSQNETASAYSSAYNSSGVGDSITEDFAGTSFGASSYLSNDKSYSDSDSSYSSHSRSGGRSDNGDSATTEHEDDGNIKARPNLLQRSSHSEADRASGRLKIDP